VRRESPAGPAAAVVKSQYRVLGPMPRAPQQVPDEITGLTFLKNKQAIQWDADPNASPYDVVSGKLSALPVGPGDDDEGCSASVNGRSIADPSIPPAGDGYWYLVRGKNSSGAGGYGFEVRAGFPPTPRTTTTCSDQCPAAGSLRRGTLRVVAKMPV